MNNIELLSTSIDGIQFRHVKICRNSNGSYKYNLKVLNHYGNNITKLFKGHVGKYNAESNSITLDTFNIHQICCYLIENYFI